VTNDLVSESNPTPQPKPWDRLPGEKDAPWEAFRRFRDMPSSKRNLTALTTIFKNERADAEDNDRSDNVPTLRYGTLNDWAKQYNWAIRVASWDAEIDRVWQEESKSVIREAARRHWENGVELQEVGRTALAYINPKLLAESSPQEVRHFLESGQKMEREALGMDRKDEEKGSTNAVIIIQMVEQLEERLAQRKLVDSHTEGDVNSVDGEFIEIKD